MSTNNVTVIDGAANSTATVTVGSGPDAVAVNPNTNKIYAVNNGTNNVTVINGATNGVITTVAVGTYPQAVSVNAITNKVYVSNTGSPNVTVINGADNSTATITVGSNTNALAVNPNTNKVYVANPLSNNVTVIDGATNNVTTTVTTGTAPDAVAVNPNTNKIYVANNDSGNVTVIDGATNNVITTVTAGTNPRAVAVNPKTNTIYVANFGSNNVTVIDGATNNVITTVTAGTYPSDVAVNPNTNKIYVVNQATSNNVTVIDGSTNTTTTVTAGNTPLSVAVNPNTNKIYVANNNSGNVTVIDGATNTTTTVTTGTHPGYVAVNPNTNKIYVANNNSGNVTVISEETVSSPLTTSINPFVNNLTKNTTPSFSGTATTTLTNSTIKMVGFQIDSTQGPWTMAALGGGTTTRTWTGTAPSSLTCGYHTVYAVPLDDTAGTVTQLSDPVGATQAYQFLESNNMPLTYYVDSINGRDSNSGLTALDAFQTINTAESVVSTGDAILVKHGTYRLPATITLKNGVYLGGGYDDSWNPTNDPSLSIISGEGSVKCLSGTNLNSATIIECFTINNGYNSGSGAAGCGGGLVLTTSSPTIRNCAFTSNRANSGGGGVFATASSPVFQNCTFTSNKAIAGFGGGIYGNNSTPEVLNCTFESNSADATNGGGIASFYGSPTISNCAFASNSASTTGGGGIYIYEYAATANITIENCTFTSNTGASGGGIYSQVSNSTPTISNCLFIFNISTAGTGGYGGGGIYCIQSSPIISNCTLTENTAVNGGGLYSFSCTPTVKNSIIYGNSAVDIQGNNPTITYSCFPGIISGAGVIHADPLFVNASAGDAHLYNNSPCVDKGTGEASDLGLGFGQGYGTHSLAIYGDAGRVNMGYHYSGYTNSEQNVPDSTPPTITLYSPAAGNAWVTGTSRDITWEASDSDGLISPVTIYYSTNEGKVYTKIDTCDATLTSYPWTVPNLVTNEAKIKITMADAYYNLGTGESGEFSIRHPATWYVDAASPEGNSGMTPESPLNTINSAESAAIDGDEIHVRMGVYSLTAPHTGTITLEDGVYLRGGYDNGWNQIDDPSITIISGEGSVRCLYGDDLSSATTIENLTIQGGYVNEYEGDTGGKGAGAALFYSSPTITNCAFNNNRAVFGLGGGLYLEYSSPTILNCAFVSNYTYYQGGGIYMFRSFSTFSSCSFESNYAGDAGGGLCIDGSSPEVSNCTFILNRAGGGAGISNSRINSGDASFPFISNCAFISNSAEVFGGGMLNDNYCFPTISNCTFTSNSGGIEGGGMYNETFSSPTISNCSFESNIANYGGGMYSDSSSTPEVLNCDFISNSADSNGGGMFNSGVLASTVSNCAFTSNHADSGSGGGLWNYASSPTVENCAFTSNTAENGGGLENDNSSPDIENTTFILNSVSNGLSALGGGMANIESSLPVLNNCAFISNHSSGGGGGIYNGASTPEISNCTITSNSATSGGGIANYCSSPGIINSIIFGNSVDNISNGSSSPDIKYSCIEGGYLGDGNISDNPQFVAGLNNVHLYNTSPCVNYGTGEAFDLGLGSEEGYGTNQNTLYGDSLRVNMGYHYSGYAGPETDISDTTPPSVTVYTPSGSTVWSGGESRDITWDASDSGGLTDPVTIYYSTDEGATYNKIGTCEYTDKTYSWTVPNINTNEAMVKVTVPDNSYNLGSGASPAFTIGSVPLAPTNLSTINKTTTTAYSSWSVPAGSPAYYVISYGTNADNADNINTIMTTEADYSWSGLNPATQYYWKVLATNEVGAGPYSTIASFKTRSSSLTVWYVDAASPEGNSGTTPESPFNTIQSAESAAFGGDEIHVRQGIYSLADTGTVTLEDGVYLRGGYDNGWNQGTGTLTTIISGEGSVQCMYGIDLSPTTTIEGFTIQNGSATDGGGLYLTNSSPTVKNFFFVSNNADHGGGIYNTNYSSPAIFNCTFTSNSAFWGTYSDGGGGGIYNSNHSSPVIYNCIIYGNPGGSILNDSTSSSGVNYSCIQGGCSGIGNISTDPLFRNAPNDVHLYANSPCVNTGTGEAFDLGLGSEEGYGTHPLAQYGDSLRVNMGYHYSGYTGPESNITDHTAPAVSVEDPAGGVSWVVGSSKDVDWMASDSGGGSLINPITIYYSIDGGASYPYKIATKNTTDSDYMWTIPGTPTTDARIKITAVDSYYNLGSGASQVFNIVATPLAPTGLVTTNQTTNSADSSWTVPDGQPDTYIIRWGTDPTATNGGIITTTAANYSWSGLTPATTYYWKVSGSNEAGEGLPSAIASFKTWRETPAIWYVDAASPEGNSGDTPESPFRTINSAESAAYGNDQILVKQGTYDLTDPGTGTIILGNGVSLTGGYDDSWTQTGTWSATIVDGGNAVRCMYGSGLSSSTTIEYFTIMRGNSGYSYSGNGGGIYLTDSSPTITNCAFALDHAASYGGGIYYSGGAPIISDCIFTSNSADSDGGALFGDDSAAKILDCTFTSNNVDDYGGAIFNANSSGILIANCIFTSNSAGGVDIGGGGAICNAYSSLDIVNCIFTTNSAHFYGGGAIYNNHSSPHIYGCTFAADSAPRVGGAIWNVQGSHSTIVNSIVYGCYGGDIFNDPADSSLSATYCDIGTDPLYPGVGNINGNPYLVDPLTGDVHIASNSPCINAGTPDAYALTYNLTNGYGTNPDGVHGDSSNVNIGYHYYSAGYVLPEDDISDITPPAVTVYSPAGGERWIVGSTHDISWTAADENGLIYPITIYYATGETDVDTYKIDTVDISTTHYTWTVPFIASTWAEIKIVALDHSYNSGTGLSNAFTILSKPLTPEGLFTNGIAETTANGTWEVPVGLPTYYIVSYGIDPSASNMGTRITYEASYTWPVLSPNTKYYWKVLATNEAGSSAYSRPVSFETLSGPPGPLTFYVNANAPGPGPGIGTIDDPFKTINSAEAAVMTGTEEIHVMRGVYSLSTPGTGTISLESGTFLMACNYDWTPADDPSLTVISGDAAVQCLYGSGLSSATTIEGFTIQNGRSTYGGGFYLTNSSPTIINCAFTSNCGVGNGGAIENDYSSSPTISNCTFTSNEAPTGAGIFSERSPVILNCNFILNTTLTGVSKGNGGGIYQSSGTYPVISNCTFESNNAYSGGGIFDDNSFSIINNCTFTSNSADASGGGILHQDSSAATIENCAFTSNHAPYGGGIDISSSSPIISNCVFTLNSAETTGGGILNISSSPIISNCTITSNSAPYGAGAAGGICNNDSAPIISNSIIYGNSGGSFLDTSNSHSTVTYSCIDFYFVGVGNISDDPQFVNGPAGDVHLSRHNNSPCISTGTGQASDLGLGWEQHYGTNPDGIRGDTGIVDMGYHYYGYQQPDTTTLTWYVDSASPEGNSGMTPESPFKTINEAELVAVISDEIHVKHGVYSLTAPNTGTITLEDGVYLRGGYDNGWAQTLGPSTTIISGEGSVQCVYGLNLSSATTIEYFTIKKGYNSDAGGGLYLENSSPTISNCFFTLNSAEGNGGGGIYLTDSSPTILYCDFVSNEAGGGDGGGIYNAGGSSIISNCSFASNSGGGGGIFNSDVDASLIISNCSFTSNSGDGIFNNASNPTISNCVFISNSSPGSGGGIENNLSSPTISNCAFALNSASMGGGIWNNFQSNPIISDCTFTLNSASDHGAGIDNSSNCHPVISNSIIYGNLGASIIDESASSSTVTYSCIQGGWEGEGNISAEPLFVYGTNNVHLYNNSPCINTGIGNAFDLGLGSEEGYGTHPLAQYGDALKVNMGYHYSGYTGPETDINDIMPPTIEVISPAPGDTLTGGASYNITWEVKEDPANLIGPIMISYSTDEGATYNLIAADANVNHTSHSWTVPNINTAHARIKVAVADYPAYNLGTGESGVFSIGAGAPTARIWYVDAASPEGNSGMTPGSPFKDINSAESIAGYGDEIHVKKGTYYLYSGDGGPGTGPQTITLYDGIYLRGGYDDGWNQVNDPALTIISGEGNVPCLYGSGLTSAAIIDNFTIEDGYSSASNGSGYGYGSGLYLDSSSLTISNCDFTSNNADYGGGGIFISDYSAPEISNCNFDSNISNSGNGGGIFNDSSSVLTISNCAFTSNNAAEGGGIYNFLSASIESCAFTSNTAYYGGGIFNISTATIDSCTFTSNTAEGGDGGGVANYDYANSGISNCTFESNSAIYDSGGGLYCDVFSSMTVSNCSFKSNSAYNKGGGVYCAYSDASIESCDFTLNSANIEGGGLDLNDSYTHLNISNCTFNSNYAYYGGGIVINNASPTFENCALISNGANIAGGVYSEGTSFSPTFLNCTVTLNRSDGNVGGGLFNYGSSMTIFNSIIYWNSGQNLTNYSAPSAVNVTCSCVQAGDTVGTGFDGTGNISADPFFAHPELGDVHLYNNSPCVNSGEGQAEDWGLSYNEHYGTNPDGVHGDDGLVDMGYHYSGYSVSANLITDTTLPIVEVYSPANGDVWTGGTLYDITWEASDDQELIDNPISIYYSIDGGTTYNLIVAGITNSGRYSWAPPTFQRPKPG